MEPVEREQGVRAALAHVARHGPSAVWLPEVQPLLDLPAVASKVAEFGSAGADRALLAVLRDAVARMGTSQYARLLTISLALDPAYEDVPLTERRAIAGREFRGGEQPVSPGTIRQHHEPRALDQLAHLLVAAGAPAQSPLADAHAEPLTVQWHPDVHERWAGERLCFWRLRLARCDRAQLLDRMRQLMRRAGVRSWSLREQLGRGEVLLRTWLAGHHHDFERLLGEVFHDDPDMVVEPFVVSEVVMHWMWTDPTSGELRRPVPARLDRAPTDRELRLLSAPTPDRLEIARHEQLICVGRPAPGIEVVVTVQAPRHPPTRAIDAALRARIVSLLQGERDLSQVSLYRGAFGEYLIEARVPAQAFHRLQPRLLDPLVEIANVSRSRVMAAVIATQEPLAECEELPPRSGEEHAEAAAELLRLPEGRRLEVKGAAFLNLSRWLATGEWHSSGGTREALAATIVGMLNADGGQIVIGALEARASRRRGDESSWLAAVPRLGDYLICGVEPELERGWDDYERRLLDLCRTTIVPDTTGRVRFQPERVEDRTLCIVSVAPPSSGQPWFYHRSARGGEMRFVVRSGSRTVPLGGPEADEYKRVHRRVPSSPNSPTS